MSSDLARQFIAHYYNVFDSNRAGLVGLYNENSYLSFEGDSFQGASNIAQKLSSLAFTKVNHRIVTVDSQPGPVPNTHLVFVSGQLVVDDSPNPLNFSQCFQLFFNGNTYIVVNDIFRLNYG